tara:strand:+ start:3553 stop:3930 length:378 start_codon:yes stop_codon:yes gene_type:complete
MNLVTEETYSEDELLEFKSGVKEWLSIDAEIKGYQKLVRDLNKRKKTLEPSLTKFMNNYKVESLKTGSGKVVCSERNTKASLNKNNIRENLSLVLEDNEIIEKAMSKILDNRDIKTTYKLVLSKK